VALIIKDRVKETTTTTGTGTLTLAGAATGFQTFSSAIGNANTCYYAIALGSEWETGLGTYTSSGNTLSRDVVLESSNAGSLVTFSAGSKEVFVTYPAAKSVYVDNNNTVTEPKYVATLSTSGSLNQGAFTYGTLGYSDTDILASFQSSSNSYNQVIIQNTNSGSSASADLTISNNNGTASTNYANFGINSSGWTGTLGTNSFSSPNVTYISATSGDLVIGTTTSNAIRFVTNGGADKLIFDANGNVGIGVVPTGLDLLELGAGTTAKAPLGFTAGANLTSADAGSVEYDGKALYFTPIASQRGVVVTESFIATTATRTLTSATTLQSIFAGATGAATGALTVNGATAYYFECSINLSAMSATSGNLGFSIGGAGGATFTSAAWHAIGLDATAQNTGAALGGIWSNAAAQTGNIVTAAAGTAMSVIVKGIFRINAGGTIIPSVQLTTAAAAVIGVDTWFKCYPIGTNTVITVGQWS